MAARASHTSSPFPRHIRNAQTVSRVPDLCEKSAQPRTSAAATLKIPLKTDSLVKWNFRALVDPNTMTAMWERDYHLS
jgi:hypothetical protein